MWLLDYLKLDNGSHHTCDVIATMLDDSSENGQAFIIEFATENLLIHCPMALLDGALCPLKARKVPSLR